MEYNQFPVSRTDIPHSERRLASSPHHERLGLISAEGGYESGSTVLGEYWQALRRRMWIVVIITILGVLAGILFSLWQTPTYRADATIEIQGLNENFLNMKDVTPVALWSVANDDIQSQIRVIQSRTLLERVIARLNIRTPEDLGQKTASTLAVDQSSESKSNAAAARDMAVNIASRKLGVRAVGRTRMVEISYEAANPDRAAEFVNALTDEFIANNIETRWQMNRQTREWINGQLEETRKKLAVSEDALRMYAKRSGLVILDEKNNVSEDKLRRLQEEMTRGRADRIEKEARYAIARNAAPESLPDLLKDDLFREYQAKLAALKQQKAELSTAYTPEYSKVKRIAAQIASQEEALDHYRTTQLDRIRNQYEEAVKRERLLTDNYAAETQNLIQEGAKSVEYGMLKREVDSNRELYDAMSQRTKEVAIASALKASNVKVIDPAVPPRKPSSPIMALNAAVGFVGSFMLSMLVVAVRERGDTIRRPGELRNFLSIAELGEIRSAKHRFLAYRGRARYIEPSGVLRQPDTLFSSDPQRNGLITLPRELSSIAHSIQSVLASIFFSQRFRTQPGAVVVTSPNAGEGKTTVAASLAANLTEMHDRVLLIDGDVYRPRLHELLGVSNVTGLTDLLETGTEMSRRALLDNARETGVPGLFLLTAGSKRGSSVFQTEAVMHLISEARSCFKVIVIDTPPMLEFADARVLGRCSDGVVLIARSGVTTRAAALAASQRLADDQINILGAVLNDWDPKSSPGWYARD